MKRLLAGAICAAALISANPSLGHGDLVRSEEGSVLIPTARDSEEIVFTGPASPISKHARCAFLLSKEATGKGEDANGLVGYAIAISEEEADGKHTYTLTSDEGDIGVVFYESFGVCEGNAVSTGEGREVGNDEGVLPRFTTYAMVVVEGAANVDFEFSIYAPEEEEAA